MRIGKLFCNDNNQKKTSYWWCGLLVLLFVFMAFGYGIHLYAIADMNEALYAEIAREMLELHNYVIPHLNYVPYLEKPPLFYWLIALSYKTFGVSAFAARLIPALSAVALSLLLIWFLNKVKRLHEGFFAAIILASSYGFILISRVVFFDGLLTAFLTAALCCFYLWYSETEKHRVTVGTGRDRKTEDRRRKTECIVETGRDRKTEDRRRKTECIVGTGRDLSVGSQKIYLRFFYILLACAVLTKGLLALSISIPVIILFLLFTNTSRKFIKFLDPIGIGLFLLIIIPWHVLAAFKLSGFTWDYFINEQLFRFLNKRIPHDFHTGPIYFYIPRIFVYLAPWSILIPTLFKRWRGKISEQDPLKIFLWIWFFWLLLLLSLSGAKGDYYMVVGVPPLAMLIAHQIESYVKNNRHLVLGAIFVVVFLLLTTAIFYIQKNQLMQAIMLHRLEILLVILILYFMVGLFLMWRYRNALINFILIAGFIIPMIVFYVNFERSMRDYYTQFSLAQYIKQHDIARDVYLFKDYEELSSSLFYLQKRLYIIDSDSRDLYYGSTTPEAQGWFITGIEFLARAEVKPVYVIMRNKELNNFQNLVKSSDLHFCKLAITAKAVLVSNRCRD